MKTITKKITFRRLNNDEQIKLGDMHSLSNGDYLNHIINLESIGQFPRDFSEDRSFWRIDTIME